jgi:NAD(P)H-dependent nitrite reductase small subunit
MAWTAVCNDGDVPSDEGHVVEAGGRRVALFRAEGEIFAIDDECPHEAGTSLALGWIDGFTIECPYHQSCFDLRTGAVLSPPADRDVACYRVRIENGAVELDL